MNVVRRLLRYGTVSLISTTLSMSILGALVYSQTMSATWANVVATAAGTVPSFELNRRWVWGKTGRRSAFGEVMPFWLLAGAGLALSTVAVAVVTPNVTRLGYGPTARALAADAANIAAFGSLWILQFVLLDRVLFRDAPPSPTNSATTLSRLPATSRTVHP
ncbi:MAG: hypothetical protein QOF97_1580 [Acidimicrobiaceae bacterium]